MKLKTNKVKIYYLIFFMTLNTVFSQHNNNLENIYSIKIETESKQYLYPVIDKNETITLSFDDLNLKENSYYYQLNHFDYKWNKSKLFKSDYISGYDDNLITDYENSFNTLVNYTNYKISIPNNDIKIKISGNFSISIHNSDGDFLFERKFSVIDKKVLVNIEISKPKDLRKFETHQSQDITIKCTNCLDFKNNSSSLKLVVIKNNQWENSVVIEKPDFFFNNKLVYKNILFPGGNEFFYFDNSNINVSNLKIFKTELYEIYNTYLRTDFERKNGFYQHNPDINGSYLINQKISNPEIENDYSLVKFSFKPNQINLKNRIFIVGEFNNFETTKKHELELKGNIYVGSFLFKQGFYNYKYFYLNSDNELKSYSGDFWETENIYTTLIFHKKNSDKHYSLIGYKTESSSKMKN